MWRIGGGIVAASFASFCIRMETVFTTVPVTAGSRTLPWVPIDGAGALA